VPWAELGRRSLLVILTALSVLALVGGAAAGPTDLEQISPLIWVVLAISVGAALVTYAFMAYAVYKFRDPATKGRRYG
jgi:amino acid transporter